MPGALVGAVIGELAHDKVVDAGQGYAARGALLDGHGDESDVATTGVPDRGAASVRVALNRASAGEVRPALRLAGTLETSCNLHPLEP